MNAIPKASFSAEDLQKVRNFIYKETGMLFEEKKDYFLQTRIEQRMQATGLTSFGDYYHLLVFAEKREEILAFVESITINETYFFRDFGQLQGFADIVLPFYAESRRLKDGDSVSIWCAACSTGEEAYTLSIILQEVFDEMPNLKMRVDATDIDRNVLNEAETGIYSERSMKDTPIAYRNKYFVKAAKGWKVLKNARDLVSFSRVNLIDRNEMRKKRGYDFVFCRNVLIYFDDESRRKVVSYLYDALKPGGYLFLGHSESVARISAAFELERIGGFLCYKKPEVKNG